MSSKDIMNCFTRVIRQSGTAASQLYSRNPVQHNDSKKSHSTTITYLIYDWKTTDKNTVNFTSKQRIQLDQATLQTVQLSIEADLSTHSFFIPMLLTL